MIGTRETLQLERDKLRNILVTLPTLMQENPQTWFRGASREVVRLWRNRDALPPEIQLFLVPRLQHTRERLKEEVRLGKTLDKTVITDDFIAARTEMVIMDVSHKSAEDFIPELSEIPQRTVTIDELLQNHPDMLRRYTYEKDGTEFTMLGMRDPQTEKWHDVPLPLDDTMWYKGGIARAVLKIHAGSEPASVSSELPPNDLDVAFIGNVEKARINAEKMGVDPDGVEQVAKDDFDFSQYCHGRDISMNQVCLGLDGLHYSEDAYNSAQSGFISLVSQYIPIRAIYGVDRFLSNGTELDKPRGAMRYLKSAAEGKAASFDYPEINRNTGLGLYPIILAKRWSGRDNFGELVEKMFYLCKQMGLVRDGADVFDFLNDAHCRYPFFDIDKKILTLTDVERWKAAKLVKQLDREFGIKYSVPSGIDYQRSPGDTNERILSLDGFSPTDDESARIRDLWPEYVNACRLRKEEYDRLNINPLQQYFYQNEIEPSPEFVDSD